MFHTNRSLLALWLALLALYLFVMLLGTVTQQRSHLPLWISGLELIFLFAMAWIHMEIGRVGPQKMKDLPVQEPAKQSALLRLLGALIYVVIVVAAIIPITFLSLLIQRLDRYSDTVFLTIYILFAVARMLFTLRSHRLATFEKRKQIPATSD